MPRATVDESEPELKCVCNKTASVSACVRPADSFSWITDVTFGDHVTASPALYPIAMDSRSDTVQLARLTKADYEAASFLDSRLLGPGVASGWGPWSELRDAADGLRVRCHFIFHISHVGSTLLSRLLGQHLALFSLREPAILRNLANVYITLDQPNSLWSRTEFGERLSVYLALWSRTFDREQIALIKATSFVSEMAEHLMARVMDTRSIFMFVRPLTFLKALLDGAMSDIEGLAEQRLSRLHRRLGEAGWQLSDLSPGERVAMSWLSEMLALRAAAARFRARVLWLDFDDFLSAPQDGLAAALNHLAVGAASASAREILAGPTMTRYAKAPAYKFDADHRDQLLRQAEERHVSEIGRGLEWLDRAAAACPAVQNVLDDVTCRPPTR